MGKATNNYMKRALKLAAKGRGRVSPHPLVGAVIVKDNKIIAEGYHRQFGEDHAEMDALKRARNNNLEEARMYVTLEPCHLPYDLHGKRVPCTDVIIRSGLKEVFVATLDSNPEVSERGIETLKKAGIQTHLGLLSQQAIRLNEVYHKYITTKQPFVIASYSMSIDGKIATKIGDSKWVSGQEARRFIHRLRDSVDAIAVGIGTVIADNPRLTTRLPKKDVRHPLRIIVDSTGRTPLSARVVSGNLPGKTIVATTKKMQRSTREQLVTKGTGVVVLPETDDGVSLVDLMDVLGERKISSILVEGGGELLASFFRLGLVDKVYAFIAPKIVGGDTAPTPVRGEGIERLSDAIRLINISVKTIGDDILITGYVSRGGDR